MAQSAADALRQEYRPHRPKRIFDLVLAVPFAALSLPVLVLMAAIIRVSSKGPVVYAQTRVGRHGIPFRCYKLRTMHVDTPSVPTHEMAPNAVTPVGRFLRRTKLDELPQLWNVLRGDMSLVGPRPCLPEQEELIRHRLHQGVLAVAPGMTGLSQVRGIDMSNPALCAKTDAEYLRNWSLGRDVSLLAQTFWRS